MKIMRLTFFLIVSILFSVTCYSEPTIFFSDATKVSYIGNYVSILEDKTNHLTLNDVIANKNFKQSNTNVPNLGVTDATFWVKFNITNQSNEKAILLELSQPNVEIIELYCIKPDGSVTIEKSGINFPYSTRKYDNQNYWFDLDIIKGQTNIYYLKLKSSDQLMLPLSVGNQKTLYELATRKDMLFGVFFGLMIVMLLYNLFVYFSVRDHSYLFYVLYIAFVCLLQTTLQGYSFRFLWPNNLWLAKNSVFLLPSMAGIAAMLFAKVFLHANQIVALLNKILSILIGVFFISILLVFVGKYQMSFGLMQLNTMVGSLFVLYMSYRVYRKGNTTAKFFLIGWSVLLVGATIFVLKDLAILPYNILTNSILEIGTATEVVLLSFALADRINVFRKEKEISQAQTVAALQENERIIREQNVTLEAKVTERTHELKIANEDLNTAMIELKEAQSQLVESEKMASLGQLTAGIAHEINNPINFVSSNVMPLNRDVKMLIDTVETYEKIIFEEKPVAEKKKQIDAYKEDIDYDYLKIEIDQLLRGIGEGASRTAEIVKGLRIFSRLDEDDLKKTDINEGIESTLVITNNLLGTQIKIEKKYANIPLVECYAGKLNQVFLNIISNAAHAIKKKFGENNGGMITISTSHDEESVYIKIADNGTGMDENTRKRLFEPFFTTKDVGEGTGLGMSIAYNTIAKHNGQINVNSEIGIGTEFTLILPLTQK